MESYDDLQPRPVEPLVSPRIRDEVSDLGIPYTHPALKDENPVLEIDRFSLWYGASQALFDITMPIPAGRATALIGPSGCGKSTLIRSVNRLNDLLDGVRIHGNMRLNSDSIYAP